MYGTMYGNMPRMLKTTVYLTDDLKRRVERVAEDKSCSEAEIIRAALEEYTQHERPRPRFPLFSAPPIEDWDEAMRGFGKD
jgi:Ribbon-helix-helix protein, copG family